jgi:hypothetical protein
VTEVGPCCSNLCIGANSTGRLVRHEPRQGRSRPGPGREPMPGCRPPQPDLEDVLALRRQLATKDRLASPIQNPSMDWVGGVSGSWAAPNVTNIGAKCSMVGWA